MVDPLTAFSTAASALQFAEVAVKLIRKSIEYSAGGGSCEHQVLQNLIQQLTVSNVHLETSLGRHRPDGQSHGPARALYLANEECLKISQEVYRLLDGLKLNRSPTIWRSVKLALKTLTTKERFQSLIQRLEHARANLTLSLMVYSQDQSASDREVFQAGHKSLSQEMRTMTAQTKGLTSNLADLAAKFDNIHIGETALMNYWEDAIRKDALCLRHTSQRILGQVTHPNGEFTAVREQMQKLLPSMDAEILARRKILESLFFSKMHSRRHRVVRAHGSTYQWLFKHKEDHALVWHDFVDWLCHDEEQSVYWVSGKPGSGKTTLMRELDDHVIFKSTLSAMDVMLPQQESDEWLKSERDAKKDLSSLALYTTSTRPQTVSAHLATDLPPDYLTSEQSVLQNELTAWVGQGNLLTASRYFWYAGSSDERSVLGLLRGLTHQLLSQRPDLIDKVVSSEMWYSACCQDNIAIHWEETDLNAALQKFGYLTQHEDKILLLIDGLDECHTTDDQQEYLLALIQDLTKMKHIKACVSSRPWNLFRDAFRNCPQLRLEDLTKDDIERYVVDNLSKDYHFRQQERVNAALSFDISHNITDRARGVFLWVRLVVRDLLRFLRDGGRPSNLLRELDRIPRDLDKYFERMIGDIEDSYRKDSAMILLTALCNMDFHQDDGNIASGPDLLLIHLDYLSEEDNVNIVDEQNIDSAFDPLKSTLLERLDRRLASRCMGLLEVDTYPLNNVGKSGRGDYVVDDAGIYRFQNTSTGGKGFSPERWVPQNVRIEFLHRTVRDFLMLESSQQMLQELAGSSFDPHWFRCNMLVLDAASFRNIGRLDLWIRATVCFFRHIFNCSYSEEAYKLYERMVEVMNYELLSRTSSVEYAYGDPAQSYRLLAEAIIDWSDHKSTALSLAIQLDWKPYVTCRLNQELVHRKEGRPLLDYSLRRCHDPSQKPDPVIVQEILKFGAQPDAPLLPWLQAPMWAYYFQSLQYQDFADGASSQTIVRALLQSNIRKRVSRPELISVHRELCRHPLLDQEKINYKISELRNEGSKLKLYAEQAVSLRLQLTEPSSKGGTESDRRYSTLDVLRSLMILKGSRKGQTLFTEDDMVEFERLCQKPSPDGELREGRKRQRTESESQRGYLAKQPRTRSQDRHLGGV